MLIGFIFVVGLINVSPEQLLADPECQYWDVYLRTTSYQYSSGSSIVLRIWHRLRALCVDSSLSSGVWTDEPDCGEL